MASLITNIYLWMGLTFLFLILFILQFIFIIIMTKKTHAVVELKSWIKGRPIALFFQEDRYCDWRAVQPEAGIIADKDYGAFIINQKATYIDKRTKAVLLPFDASFAAGINVRAAKLADDLQYIVRDQEELKNFRYLISKNMIEESATINCIRTTVHFSAIKNMMSALIPHNINAKIEKVIASRMKGYNKVNVPQIALLFVAILGAILMGYLIIKLTTGA
jgi:hypothetical protein